MIFYAQMTKKIFVKTPIYSQGQVLSASTQGIRIVNNGIGININEHQSERDINSVASAGFTFIRTDLFWSAIEISKGQYNWQKYDRLVAKLRARNIRPLFILCYNNPDVYGGEWLDGISSPTEVKAFAKFASLAVAHFRSFKPIWEIYNEPNRQDYWKPNPNVKAYMRLAKASILAMRNVDPEVKIIAPALGHEFKQATLEYSYLEECFKQNLLPLIDGISIHPYVNGQPESVEKIYQQIQILINRYNIEQRSIPIISSEWGYSTYDSAISPQTQSDYLTRMFLLNLSKNIPISIGYALIDSSASYYEEYEKHYGILKTDYTPKLAYKAIQEMNQYLNGKRFFRRLSSNSGDYLLEFSDGTDTMIAAWTVLTRHNVTIYGRKQFISSTPQYFTRRGKLTQLHN